MLPGLPQSSNPSLGLESLSLTDPKPAQEQGEGELPAPQQPTSEAPAANKPAGKKEGKEKRSRHHRAQRFPRPDSQRPPGIVDPTVQQAMQSGANLAILEKVHASLLRFLESPDTMIQMITPNSYERLLLHRCVTFYGCSSENLTKGGCEVLITKPEGWSYEACSSFLKTLIAQTRDTYDRTGKALPSIGLGSNASSSKGSSGKGSSKSKGSKASKPAQQQTQRRTGQQIQTVLVPIPYYSGPNYLIPPQLNPLAAFSPALGLQQIQMHPPTLGMPLGPTAGTDPTQGLSPNAVSAAFLAQFQQAQAQAQAYPSGTAMGGRSVSTPLLGPGNAANPANPAQQPGARGFPFPGGY